MEKKKNLLKNKGGKVEQKTTGEIEGEHSCGKNLRITF